MADVRGIVADVAGLLLVAVRSFLGTLLIFFLVGLALAGLSYHVLSDSHRGYGLIAALVALIECLLVGLLLGGKRAIVMAVVHGLRRYQLGSAMVRLIFGRLLGVSAEQAPGERGGWVTQTVERLPLAQAEKRLGDAIGDLVHAPSAGGGLTGWLRRRMQTRLASSVRTYTLARLRDEDAQYGAIDLVKVQTDLGDRIDGLLIGKLRGGINLWTVVVLVGLPVQILAVDYLVFVLLK